MNFATIVSLWSKLTALLEGAGYWIAPFGLRLLLAKEFWDSGVEKYYGENWFADVQDKFFFPFNLLPVSFSWTLATYIELFGALALILGLATRFISVSLMILTVVAIGAVHWPDQWSSLSELAMGYTIRNEGFGNYKLPLIYLIMFLPLVLTGPGKLSLDHLIKQRFAKK